MYVLDPENSKKLLRTVVRENGLEMIQRGENTTVEFTQDKFISNRDILGTLGVILSRHGEASSFQ
jgi:hypothetical protein